MNGPNSSNIVFHLYQSASRVYRQILRFPIYFRRLQRTIARECNMEDLDDAMDYFLDVLQLVFNPRMGLYNNDMEDLLDTLQVLPYAVQHLDTPEVAIGFHNLVKNACLEIRSVDRIDLKIDGLDEDINELVQILDSLADILLRHAFIFQAYIKPYLADAVSAQDEMEDVKLEIEPANKPDDDGYTSIDE